LATATWAVCTGLPPRRQLSGRSGQTIQGFQCAIQVGTTVTEGAPGAADVFKFVEVEAVHQQALFGLIEFFDLFAELIGNERRTVKRNVVAVLFFAPDAVAGDQRHQVSASMALLHALPVIARADGLVVRLAADGGRVEQNLGTEQRHAARRLRKPLVPADAHADFRVTRVPDLEP
nr:hypothetical protein [Tanacetum cinerariifolium]